MGFYIGQKVVALVTDRVLVKGNTYVVMDLFYCKSCKCEHILYNVSTPNTCYATMCDKCDYITTHSGANYYCRGSQCFSPIEEYGDSMSLAMQLVQELDQVDKAKNPVKKPQNV